MNCYGIIFGALSTVFLSSCATVKYSDIIIDDRDITNVTLRKETEPALKPKRVFIDEEIRYQAHKSFGIHLFPKDCGNNLDQQGAPMLGSGGWNDCAHNNEKVSVTTKELYFGEKYYTVAILLDKDSFIREIDKNHYSKVNIFQWFSQPGPPFNIIFNNQCPEKEKVRCSLVSLENRISKGSYYDDGRLNDSYSIGNKELLGEWIELVAHANWSNDKNKGFFKLWANNKLITDFRGKTIVGEQTNGVHNALFLYRYHGMNIDGDELRTNYAAFSVSDSPREAIKRVSWASSVLR